MVSARFRPLRRLPGPAPVRGEGNDVSRLTRLLVISPDGGPVVTFAERQGEVARGRRAHPDRRLVGRPGPPPVRGAEDTGCPRSAHAEPGVAAPGNHQAGPAGGERPLAGQRRWHPLGRSRLPGQAPPWLLIGEIGAPEDSCTRRIPARSRARDDPRVISP
jgi:hypothetical protein